MKLGAWRDEQDQDDADVLLRDLGGEVKEDVWALIEPYLQKGREDKSWYAFETLWEDIHGDDD